MVRRKLYFRASKGQTTRHENGETVDTFITALHALAEYYDNGTLKDEIIRDRDTHYNPVSYTRPKVVGETPSSPQIIFD